MDRSDRDEVEEVFEDKLSAALVADDNELDRLLREASQITDSLKSRTRNTHTLGNVLRRAVQCAVKQSILDRELRSLALTDELTALHNRRGFLALAKQQLKVADRNMEDLLIFFADLDNLKDINDRFGHREGDLAVVRAADALKHTFRDSDIVARLGGDEFAILALETSSEYQEAILRRLRETLDWLNGNERRYAVSMSVGVARFDPREPLPLGELMARADRDMYRQKRRQSADASESVSSGG